MLMIEREIERYINYKIFDSEINNWNKNYSDFNWKIIKYAKID